MSLAGHGRRLPLLLLFCLHPCVSIPGYVMGTRGGSGVPTATGCSEEGRRGKSLCRKVAKRLRRLQRKTLSRTKTPRPSSVPNSMSHKERGIVSLQQKQLPPFRMSERCSMDPGEGAATGKRTPFTWPLLQGACVLTRQRPPLCPPDPKGRQCKQSTGYHSERGSELLNQAQPRCEGAEEAAPNRSVARGLWPSPRNLQGKQEARYHRAACCRPQTAGLSDDPGRHFPFPCVLSTPSP